MICGRKAWQPPRIRRPCPRGLQFLGRMVWASRRERQQWVVLFIAGIGGFLFGYDTGVISGALDYMGDDLYPHATPVERAALSGVCSAFLAWRTHTMRLHRLLKAICLSCEVCWISAPWLSIAQ